MPIINLTRIPIALHPEGEAAPLAVLPPTTRPPHVHDRITTTDAPTRVLPLPQVNVVRTRWVTELPPPIAGTWYVVARVVGDALSRTRSDLLVPGPALTSHGPRALAIDAFLRVIEADADG